LMPPKMYIAFDEALAVCLYRPSIDP
jgi:hypothetical protein